MASISHHVLDLPKFDRPVKVLIVVSPYYNDIADGLVSGAIAWRFGSANGHSHRLPPVEF